MIKPLLPLAKLAPAAALIALGFATTSFVLRVGDLPPVTASTGWVPLLLYLGWCQIRARRMLQSEHGRERDIVEAGFVAMSADRTARFWGAVFGLVSGTAAVAALLVWSYQAVIRFKKSAWTSITWLSVGGPVPETHFDLAQSAVIWLANTNLGVVLLVSGLLLAAPLAALHSRSDQRAKQAHKRLINLKKRS